MSYLICLLDLHCLGTILHKWEHTAPGAKIIYVQSGCISTTHLPTHDSDISINRTSWVYLLVLLLLISCFLGETDGSVDIKDFMSRNPVTLFLSGSSLTEVLKTFLHPASHLSSLLNVQHLPSSHVLLFPPFPPDTLFFFLPFFLN